MLPRRIHSIVLLFALLIGGMGMNYVQAATYSGNCGASGNNVTWSLNTSTGVLTISGTGAMADYASAGNVPWKDYRSSIKKVNIGRGVTTVGSQAFQYCSAMTSVSIPESVTSIGWFAFGRCSSLTSITIPNTVTTIEDYVFYDCSALTHIYVSWASGIPAWQSHFINKTASTINLHVPCLVKSLYQSADGWKNCTIVDEVPSGKCGTNLTWSLSCDGVLTIRGTGAMADWSAATDVPWYNYRENITSVVLPYGLTHIGAYAFYGTAITKIDLPITVRSFGKYAFLCRLQEICIPEGVTELPEYLFSSGGWITGGSPLKRVYLPTTLTKIGNHAISAGHELSTLTYPASVTSLGLTVYNSGHQSPVKNHIYASWTTNIPSRTNRIETALTPKPKMHIPYGTSSAFSAKGWERVYDLVEDVDERAIDLGLSIRWASCNVGATAPEENGDFYAWGDTLTRSSFTWGTYPYSGTTTNTMTKYCTRAANGTVDNRSTLIAFDDAAYIRWGETWRMPTWTEWNELITQCTWKDTTYNDVPVWQVTGPNGNSIYLPKVGYKNNSSVTAGCYYWSSTLNTTNSNDQCNRALYINAADRSGAKYGWRYLGAPVRAVYRREWPSFTLTITDTPDGTPYTKSVNAGSSYTLTAQEDDCHQFVQWSDGNTSNPRTVSVTADATYTAQYEDLIYSGTCGADGDNLTWTLNACDSILTISGTGEMMNFNNNDLQWLLSRSLIRTVVIEEGVTSIGTWAFKGCTNIEHVEIPSSVTTIGERAFIWAYGLESIHIPEGVVTIEKRVFEGCNNLKNITLPNTLETIGTYCFLNCTSLREITIPNSVSEIGSNALKTCTALTDIHVSWENADAIPDWLNLTNKDPQSDITLHIPCGTTSLYQAANGWKEYTPESEGGPYTITVRTNDDGQGSVSIPTEP